MARGSWVLCVMLLDIALAFAADPQHLVQDLPGQPAVGFRHYAGQIQINATADRSLFYWFYEADHPNASSLPLVLWLNGGPGCSSIGAGALEEIGPFRVNATGTGLFLNPYSWNKAANFIFLEVPYNTGFSFTNLLSDDGFWTDNQTAVDSLLFLIEFLSKFSEYKQNEFYIAGESFAGHFIPTLASKIIGHNQQGDNPIKFKGFAIGNPSTDDLYDVPGNRETLFAHAVISEELYEGEKLYCNKPNATEEESMKCSNISLQIFILQLQVSPYNLYSVPTCNPCLDAVTNYLNLPEVQAALHVQTRPVRWTRCNPSIDRSYLPIDKQRSMLPVYRDLFEHNLRIWIYSGDVDSVVSTLSTRRWLKALNLSVVTSWYGWGYPGEGIAYLGGRAEVYDSLTFASVRGAGHQVPRDKPGEALFLFKHFIAGTQLPPANDLLLVNRL
ncbi:serine carboxypeptidase 24 isoform X2 [Selaginella moellendorffii]|uniref:serine carboxypeptidase 24 isoform X2 n=1 Tax=Selaginella moellendorffii TaxID=88036 RepID=UPI000D1CA70D|nr:serine carboxypeptidase 24 isoform X2 [Selaginella moellendorffii]|eukprot:XP_024528700.1 serine carboxypeptidase 24 isoform X2 [Selaginella moellendorffii]